MPWVPALGAFFCIVQMVVLPWATWERLLIWLAAGMLVYFFYGRRGALKTREKASARRAA
jgi:APA family basic amino acid/polyamine antiporter